MKPDKRSDWLRKLDEECPYQVVLPRRQLTDDSAILDFLLAHVGKFDMYVEDDYAAFVRYCFEDPLDAEIFSARFEQKRIGQFSRSAVSNSGKNRSVAAGKKRQRGCYFCGVSRSVPLPLWPRTDQSPLSTPLSSTL